MKKQYIQTQNQTIHHQLAYSYAAYLVFSIFGIAADIIFRISYSVPYREVLAIFLLVAGPILIWWAQYSSRKFEQEKDIKHHFYYGPYAFIRNPTHVGLMLLVGGYAVLTGSLFFLMTTFVGYLISRFFYQRHESLLEQKYKDEYQLYKIRVKKIL